MNSTQETTMPVIVRTAIDAANAHDTDAFLDCFAEAGAVDDWGRVFAGRAAIKRWSDREFIGCAVELRDVIVITVGDDTAVRVQVGGNGYTGPGTFTFTLQGSKIKLMRITG